MSTTAPPAGRRTRVPDEETAYQKEDRDFILQNFSKQERDLLKAAYRRLRYLEATADGPLGFIERNAIAWLLFEQEYIKEPLTGGLPDDIK